MGRLIDADEFMKTVLRMKRLNEECPLSDIYLENEKINNYETGQRETFDLITEHLDAQPTAYDPDKVVEKLEEIRAKKTCNKEKCDEKELCRICVVDDAIEIVKAGGNADLLIDRAKSKSGERIPYDGKWK